MTAIVVPVYNGAHVLPQTVPAVLAQEGVDEWVWVDDGSTDETASLLGALLAGESRARLVRQPENTGRSAARNRGLDETTGSVVAFFDADVRPRPTRRGGSPRRPAGPTPWRPSGACGPFWTTRTTRTSSTSPSTAGACRRPRARSARGRTG